MRKLLFMASIAALLVGCKMPQYALPEPYVSVETIDYTSLTESGYFVTESNSVPFDYQSVGSVNIEVHGGWIKKNNENEVERKEDNRSYSDDYYMNVRPESKVLTNLKKSIYIKPDVQSALKELQIIMDEKGADGILNLRMSCITEPATTLTPPIEHIRISGMLFKRK